LALPGPSDAFKPLIFPSAAAMFFHGSARAPLGDFRLTMTKEDFQ
jgi:hypothetical protein